MRVMRETYTTSMFFKSKAIVLSCFDLSLDLYRQLILFDLHFL